MNTQMNIRDCFIRLVDPTGVHKPTISAHRVWDFQLFVESQRQTYEIKAKEGDKRIVEVCDEADWLAFSRKT